MLLTFSDERAFVRATGANAATLASDAKMKRALNILTFDIVVRPVYN